MAIGRAIEEEIGNRQGQRADLGLVQNFAQVDGKKTIEIAAAQSGFGNKETYRQAKKVVDEAIPEIIGKMDSGGLRVWVLSRLKHNRLRPKQAKGGQHWVSDGIFDGIFKNRKSITLI